MIFFFKRGAGAEGEGEVLYHRRVPFPTSCFSIAFILIYERGILETRLLLESFKLCLEIIKDSFLVNIELTCSITEPDYVPG